MIQMYRITEGGEHVGFYTTDGQPLIVLTKEADKFLVTKGIMGMAQGRT